MSTTLTAKPLKRQIHIHGIDEPVNLYLTDIGLELGLKGFKQRPYISWAMLVGHLKVPASAPSYLHDNPLQFLKEQSKKLKKKQKPA